MTELTMTANHLIMLMGSKIQERVAEEMLRELQLNGIPDELREKVREIVLENATSRIVNSYHNDGMAAALYKKVGAIAAEVVEEPAMQTHFRDAAMTAVKNYTANDLDRWVRQKINEVLTQSIEEIVNERVLAAMKLQKQLAKTAARRKGLRK